ncbi:MAG: DNA adenine methylase, partial [Candidatus Methanoplasma sp.]|nr:DNA adenine methylase [Candidatus Methanoplasma sp.]
MRETRSIKPYLKWAGGKRQLSGEISARVPKDFGRYYEPFVGAGAILFTLRPEKAVINDLNEQLCLTYKVIRDDVDHLIELLEIHKNNN